MLKILTSLSLALLITTPVMAIDNNNSLYFPAVAQGHSCTISNHGKPSKSDQLDMEDDSQINGTLGEALDFCSIEDDLEGECDGGACAITGTANRTPAILLPDSLFEIDSHHVNTWPSIHNGAYHLESGSYSVSSSKLEKNVHIKASGKVNVYVGGEYELEEKDLTINGDVDFYFEDKFELEDAGVYINGHVRFFVRKSVDIDKSLIEKQEGSSFYLYAHKDIKIEDKSVVNGYVYAGEKLELQDKAQINGRVTAKELEMGSKSVIEDAGQGTVDQCFSDAFDRKDLGGSWYINTSKGTFEPGIVAKRFRLTEAKTNQATSITYNRVFPANNNSFVIEFDHYAYSGTGADGVALVLSDASSRVIPGAYGGPLGYGYKPGEPGFNGGWLGIGIDEYGNFINEGGAGNVSSAKNTVAIRGKGAGDEPHGNNYKLLARKTKLSPVIYGKGNVDRPHRYRISINFTNLTNKAYVTIERNTDPYSKKSNNSYTTLIDNQLIDQGPIPKELLLTITGSTGDSTSIHEIDNTLICAARTSDFEAGIDHFRFDFSGDKAQACTAQKVTLIACANSTCSSHYNLPIHTTLATAQPGMKWQGGSTIEFSGGSKELYLESIPGKAKLDILSSTPNSTLLKDILCQVNGKGYAAKNCEISFVEGDKFFELSIPYAYAGEPVEALLKPQKDCKALYENIEKDITFSISTTEPTIRTVTPDLLLTNNAEELKLNPSTADTVLTTNVHFNESGEGRVTLFYPEAGVNQITVSHDGMTGTEKLITVPRGLCVTVDADAAKCAAQDASCSPFVAAGELFNLNVSAHGLPQSITDNYCSGPVLQNYQQEINLSSQVLAPSSDENGQLSVSNYGHNATEKTDSVTHNAGINEVKQSISEVGVFSITAMPASNYFGSTKETAAGVSDPIGRFYPARFVLDSGEVKSKNEGTDTESYMDQPFKVNFTVSAVSKDIDRAVVKNYVGAFAKGSVQLNALVDSKNVNSRLSPTINNPMTNWVDGQLSFPSGDVAFIRNSGKPDGPYDLKFMLELDDGEKINDGTKAELSKLFDGRNSDSDNNCSQSAGCNELLLGKQTVRHAHIKAPGPVSNSVSEPASVPLRIEYWDTAKDNWQVFTEDNWTRLTMAVNVSFPEHKYTHPTLPVNDQIDVDAGLDVGLGSKTEKEATMAEGQLSLNVGAPNIATIIKYQLNLATTPWLAPLDNAANEGSIIFGSSPGNSSVIYRREQ